MLKKVVRQPTRLGFLKPVYRTPCPKTIRKIDLNAISRAEFAFTAPGFFRKAHRRRQGARASGLRFERKVAQALSDLHPDHFVPSPWFRVFVHRERRARWYQADGLLVDFSNARVTIIEVKLRHTAVAWWQVVHQYVPVVQKLFPGFDISVIEICCWYDRAEPFPIDTKPAENVSDVLPGEFRVLISRNKGNDVR